MPKTIPPRVPIERIQNIQSLVGVDFCIWTKTNTDWELLFTPDPSTAKTNPHQHSPVGHHLQQYGAQSFVIRQSDGTHVIGIPLGTEDGRAFVATSEVYTEDPSLLKTFVGLASEVALQDEEIVRLRIENKAFVKQVTQDFEELTFLRTFATELDVSQGTRDLLQTAESLLPLMVGSLKCEGLFLFLSDNCLLKDDVRSIQFAMKIDADGVSHKDAQKIVSLLATEAIDQPQIQNPHSSKQLANDTTTIKSFALISFTHGASGRGWLLAVNRHQPDDPSAIQVDQNEFEFGTPEAQLLIAASSIMSTQSHNHHLFREKEQLLTNVVCSLVSAVEAKDPYTCGHSERVGIYSRLISQRIGLDEDHCEQLFLTGLLHDIGKIGVSDATLHEPGRLSAEQFSELKAHPDHGWVILQELKQLNYVLPGVLHHHERYDGTGYPDRLAGDKIPLDGRIIAVADAYDAMVTDRPYRNGMPHAQAINILRDGAGSQWDPLVVEAAFAVMPEICHVQASHITRFNPQRSPESLKSKRSMSVFGH